MKRLFAVLAAGSVCFACGGGTSIPSTPAAPSTPPAAGTSTFQGTVAGSGGQSGTVRVTVQAQVAASSAAFFRLPFIATLYAQTTTVQATGTLHLVGGSTIALTGTFDSSTKALNLSGSGFTFTGLLIGAVISGSYTGPSGATGGFASQSTAAGTVTTYCGTFVGDGGVIGVFNLQVSATGAVSGIASETIQGTTQVQFISGQVSGTTVTLSTGGGADRGTIQNGTVTGTTGKPWSASTSACQ
jgi:hypothetical protein